MSYARVVGAQQFQAAVGRWGESAKGRMVRALHVAHELIMTEAKEDCPVRTGALRASGHVLPPVETGSGAVSVGAFGNAAVGYAIYVHENLAARHTVGHAKFYENAVINGTERTLEMIAEAVAGGPGEGA